MSNSIVLFTLSPPRVFYNSQCAAQKWHLIRVVCLVSLAVSSIARAQRGRTLTAVLHWKKLVQIIVGKNVADKVDQNSWEPHDHDGLAGSRAKEREESHRWVSNAEIEPGSWPIGIGPWCWFKLKLFK